VNWSKIRRSDPPGVSEQQNAAKFPAGHKNRNPSSSRIEEELRTREQTKTAGHIQGWPMCVGATDGSNDAVSYDYHP